MIKILQINAVYGKGSTGVIVHDIEKLCEQSGMECYVASPDNSVIEAKHGYVIGNVIDHKLHALFSRIHGKQAYFSHIPTKKLLKWIDYIKPDIVHLHNLHSNYIHFNMLFKYLAANDISTIITFHDCWYFTGGCSHFTSIECDKWMTNCEKCPRQKEDTPALLSKHSSQMLMDRKKYINAIPHLTIIGASEWIANECRRSVLANCNIRYIHNGFNLDIFKPTNSDIRKKMGIEDKYVLLAPASKWYQNINKTTLDYFLSHMSDDMVLLLFGCKTGNKNISDKVREIGYINNPREMAAIYSMADVFVNCTREDTLPGINLECQAAGTPVVTYDATGCKETVDGICGRAVRVGDYVQLFNAVLEIRSIGKAKLSTQCIKWIRENFELRDSYQKYLNLYKDIIRL